MTHLQSNARHAVWPIVALVALVLGFAATLATPANAAAAPFAAQNGMLVLEAEQFDSNQSRGGTSWSSTNNGSALLANPALLAAIIPADFKRKQKEGKDLPLPASVWQSPQLHRSEGFCDAQDFHFEILHGIACQLTSARLTEVGFKVLGRLKDQIVTSIGYEYHSHGSRPGFVSFQRAR